MVGESHSTPTLKVKLLNPHSQHLEWSVVPLPVLAGPVMQDDHPAPAATTTGSSPAPAKTLLASQCQVEKWVLEEDQEALLGFVASLSQLEPTECRAMEPYDLSADDQYILHCCMESQSLQLVRFLLTLGSEFNVDPSFENNTLVRWVCEHGHDAILQQLLQDPRVDPTVPDNRTNNNTPLKLAVKAGHAAIVRLLLQDPRVDPTFADHYAIRWAAAQGHLRVVKLLLQDSRVDPCALDNYAIKWASENGHAKVVQLLLLDARVDPRAGSDYALLVAVRNGHDRVVQALLADGRCDPTRDGVYLRLACAKGHVGAAKILLGDARVDRNANDGECRKLAVRTRNFELVSVLDGMGEAAIGDTLQDAVLENKATTYRLDLFKLTPQKRTAGRKPETPPTATTRQESTTKRKKHSPGHVFAEPPAKIRARDHAQVYDIQEILAKRTRQGVVEYFVKWQGWPDADWIPYYEGDPEWDDDLGLIRNFEKQLAKDARGPGIRLDYRAKKKSRIKTPSLDDEEIAFWK
ncbi:hypothetical protein HDV03_000457 [Kappamyces sp. JEL0829]|nr:hypothetical protein HDV03_000457 [Kappamyces sp. JEL0829]